MAAIFKLTVAFQIQTSKFTFKCASFSQTNKQTNKQTKKKLSYVLTSSTFTFCSIVVINQLDVAAIIYGSTTAIFRSILSWGKYIYIYIYVITKSPSPKKKKPKYHGRSARHCDCGSWNCWSYNILRTS